MKLMHYYTCAAVVGLLLAVMGACQGTTVTLDVSTKSATSDSPNVEAKWVKTSGDQIGLYIQNLTDAPQSIVLKFAGLNDGSYDLYVNWGEWDIARRKALQQSMNMPLPQQDVDPGSVVRGLTKEELVNGRTITLCGLEVPLPLIRCVRSAGPGLKAAYKQLDKTPAEDTLSQAEDWANSDVRSENTYRATQVFIIPEGRKPARMEWYSRITAKSLTEALQRACYLLQLARIRMDSELTDPLLRETVLEALTPVDVTVHYTKQNGVKVQITNNCDLDINGAIKVNAPKGWEAKAKKPTFVGLKSGESWTQSFKLTPASKGQAVPNQLSVAATIKIADKNGFAKLQIVRYAELKTE